MEKSYDPSRGQYFTVEDGVVVVEYYHFGEEVAYEFAVQVRFDHIGQEQIAKLLGIEGEIEPGALALALKDKFVTHYAVRDFADENGISYDYRRDFTP